MRAALAALLCSGCVMPVVSAGTFLPAGDLGKGDVHASISLEAGRVLASPSDVDDLTATPAGAKQYEVSTWVASDVGLRWQVSTRWTLEGQLKLTNPVEPFTPMLVGGAVGARYRLKHVPPEGGVAIEIGARAVGISAEQQIERSTGGPPPQSQTDRWNYRSLGIEVPVIVTYRINPIFALTGSPFLRAYWIRVWHDTTVGLTTTEKALEWSPVLSGGLGLAAAFDVGAVQLSPGVALELVTKPGPKAVTHFIFEPGVSVGTRF